MCLKGYTVPMPANPELVEIVKDIAKDYSDQSNQLIDLLTAIQNKLGYVPASTIGFIAEKLDITRPEIYKVIDISPSLTLTASGLHKLYICNADNCCMQGGDELMEFAKTQLKINPFQTTPDKKIRLEPFQCLGNCSMSPNVMVDGRIFGLMDESALSKLIDNLYEDNLNKI